MDATPAPASSIAPKPFRVIPIAANVWVNSMKHFPCVQF